MSLSDQIIIMNQGVIAQMGTPREIYYHPESEFVADFIGEANFLDGKILSTHNDFCVMDIAGHQLTLPNPKGYPVGRDCRMVVRPEAVIINSEGGLPCRVTLSCFMGSYHNYHVLLGDMLVKSPMTARSTSIPSGWGTRPSCVLRTTASTSCELISVTAWQRNAVMGKGCPAREFP